MRSFARAASCIVTLACLAGCESTPPKGDNKDAKGSTGATAVVDGRTLISVISPCPRWPQDGAGVKKGLWVKSVASGSYTSETLWAIVDEAGDIVKMEHQGPETNGYYTALVINKKDGKVTKALAGKKGEKLIALKPTELKSGAGLPPESETTDEDVKIAAGTFHSKKTVTKTLVTDYTTWVGVDGDVAGIMLKTQVETDAHELKVAPSLEEVTIGGKAYKAKHLVYTNGEEKWTITDPALNIPFVTLGGATVVKQIAGGSTTVNTWSDDAKPVLSWEE